MLSDQDLRKRLTAATAHLTPDLEAELEGVFRRAQRRRWTRRAAYAVGVAAAVTAAVLLVDHDWSQAQAPDPVDENPISISARVLIPGRGTFALPEEIEADRYNMGFTGTTAVRAEVDIPTGWMQDDDVSLATGLPEGSDTRRLDLFSSVIGTFPDPCRHGWEPVGPSTLDLAGATTTVRKITATSPEPTELDGHPGYFVQFQVAKNLDPLCHDIAMVYRSTSWPLPVPAGWTSRIWVVDVDGRRLVVAAHHGPDSTPDEIDELVGMVESINFVDPAPEPDD